MSGFVSGNALQLLEGGTQYFPLLADSIATARHEIYLESYIFENDATGRRIGTVLCDAARRGVRVHVLVDGFGGRSFVNTLMPVLQAAGASVLIYRREFRLMSLRKSRLRRLHRKVVVLDGRLAFVGGINIVDDLLDDRPLHPRQDYAVKVEGPIVSDIAKSARRLWWLVSWASLKRRERLNILGNPLGQSIGNVTAKFVIRDNLRHRRDIEDAYLDAMVDAREDILIACAYFFPGHRFRAAITDAAARGVRVTLLLQGLSDHPMLAYASRALYPTFLACGVRLFEYHQSELHAKVAVIDGRWATVGSSNIDPFSLLLAREANVVVDDVAFAQSLRSSLERAITRGATEYCQETTRRQPRIKRVMTWVAYQLVRAAIGIAGFSGKH